MAVEKRRGMEDQEADPLVVSPQVAARLLGGTSVKHIFDLVRSKQLVRSSANPTTQFG